MQLYRVNVLVQNVEDAQAQPPQKAPFFVLRRYNQFRQLYDAVRPKQEWSSCYTYKPFNEYMDGI